MNRPRTWCALLACTAMAASGALHAQARPSVPKTPRIEPRVEKKPVIRPCGTGPECPADARSRAAAMAWANGLDEHGAPLDAGARTRKRAEMESWLRRLAGTFRIEGTYRNHGGKSPVLGTVKCLGVGDGPGVTCVISATWKAPKESVKDPEFDKALYDAMQSLVVFLGIDPDASRIRATLMDYRASRAHGFLIDDGVALSNAIPTSMSLVRHSWSSSFIAIQPGGNLDMKLLVYPTSTQYELAGIRALALGSVPNPWIEFDMQLHREPLVDSDRAGTSP